MLWVLGNKPRFPYILKLWCIVEENSVEMLAYYTEKKQKTL